MWEQIARIGVMGAVIVSVVALFVFLTVASVVDAPGLKDVDGKQFFDAVTTLTVAIGGGAAAAFGFRSTNGTK